MTFGRHRIAAAAAVPLLVVGGCSEDPEPIIEPPAETTSVADPTPTPEAKEPWEEKSKAGAVAFAKHWFGVFSEAMRTSSTDELRSLTAARCELCDAFADRLDDIVAEGGFYESKGWRVLEVASIARPTAVEVVVSLRILQGAERFRESAKEEVIRHPDSRATWSTRLVWKGTQWKLGELRLLE